MRSPAKDASETKINPIIIYALDHCPYCKSAVKLLDTHKIKYNKIIVENDEKIKEKSESSRSFLFKLVKDMS